MSATFELPPEAEDAVGVISRSFDSQVAYRGKRGCQDPWCTSDGNPDRCYGWHCARCGGRADAQGTCLGECRTPASTV